MLVWRSPGGGGGGGGVGQELQAHKSMMLPMPDLFPRFFRVGSGYARLYTVHVAMYMYMCCSVHLCKQTLLSS